MADTVYDLASGRKTLCCSDNARIRSLSGLISARHIDKFTTDNQSTKYNIIDLYRMCPKALKGR
jgi:hypothetical protein